MKRLNLCESYGDFLNELEKNKTGTGFLEESEFINEAVTPTYKRLIKRAKELGIETISELGNLIADEFYDAKPFISGADFELAKKQLKLYESDASYLDESIDSRVRSKIAVYLKEQGFNIGDDYEYSTGQFIAKNKKVAEEIINSIKGKFRGKAYYDRETKTGKIPMMIVK